MNTCKLGFSCLFSTHLGTELRDHVVILCLTFWGTARLFSAAAVPLYIPTSSVREFQFLHILRNICSLLNLAVPVDANWYLIVVLVLTIF